MSATGDQVRGLIGQEAADWFVANRGGLNAKERERFSAWLRASPVHVEEYLGIAGITRDLRAACEVSPGELEALMARAHQEQTVVDAPWPRAPAPRTARLRGLRMAGAAAAVGLTAIAIAAWWQHSINTPVTAARPAVQVFQSRHGEQITRQLADGSVVHLNTDTSVTVEFSATRRRVTLLSGEADFEIAHEAARAFQVLAGRAQVVAVGTRFDVRLQEDSTTVTVAQGTVQVGPASAPPTPGSNPTGSAGAFVQVTADQQIRYSPDAWPATPQSVDANRNTSWLHRQITFEREPLERVASEFNRYSRKPIEIATPALRNLKISGAFATDDTEAFIAFLRSLDGVRVEVTATHIRVSQRSAPPVH